MSNTINWSSAKIGLNGKDVDAVDGEYHREKSREELKDMLSSMTKLEYIPESHLDPLCAIYGVGLEISHNFINAMAESAIKMGISQPIAVRLAARTVQSAVESLLESGRHPKQLIDDVCSPSGPAIYGMQELDRTGCSSRIVTVIETVYKRAQELEKKQKNY